MPMQPSLRPRGHALALSKAIAKAIARYNAKQRGRVTVTHVLRALEWNRFQITEACVQAIGDVPAE